MNVTKHLTVSLVSFVCQEKELVGDMLYKE